MIQTQQNVTNDGFILVCCDLKEMCDRWQGGWRTLDAKMLAAGGDPQGNRISVKDSPSGEAFQFDYDLSRPLRHVYSSICQEESGVVSSMPSTEGSHWRRD